MCGIAGTFVYDGRGGLVDEAALTRMRDVMTPRGPDGCGLWIAEDRRVGLAHRRLSIIDLSPTGAQPMALGQGRLRITYNGEIYNYRALRDELESAGCVFRSTSDTEVLLHLYDRLGREMVRKLRGMFALAIWDAERRGLFLARDPFGIKPLYVADDGKTVRFASQVTALLAGGGVDTRPEPAGHVGFFLLGSVPEPHTLYRGIRALPAGSTAWVDAEGSPTPRGYWDVSRAMREAATGETIADPQDRLRGALADSVRHHLVADVPVGLFLSSGLDSSTLTALASEQAGEGLHAVTLGFREFEGSPRDEVPLARTVAERYGARQQTRWVSASDFAGDLERLIEAMDQPSIDGVNTYFVSKVTAACGLKVALSGLGADELFGGYDNFHKIPRLVGLARPLARMPGLGRLWRRSSRGWIGRVANPKLSGVLEYGGDYPGAYLLRRGLYMPWELTRFLDAELAREGLLELDLLNRLGATVAGLEDPRHRVSALEMSWYMRNQLLRDGDWAGMAHSLEIRVPFVDVELARAVFALEAAGFRPGKQEMARTPRKPLPGPVLDRPKTGFGIPVQTWLLGDRESAMPEPGLRGWAQLLYGAKNRTGLEPTASATATPR